MLSSLKIKPGRLMKTIHETADMFGAAFPWGKDPTETGLLRLALTDMDKGARDWFAKEVKSLGCEYKVDELGNQFAIYPGKDMSAIPTGVGSHLDSQPTAGRYDGPLGVLSGLEILRTLKESNYVPNYPIALINWTNEEGARFPYPLLGSSVYAGIKPKEDMYSIKAIDGSHPTVLEELERIGYKGDTECAFEANPVACHFEIHIEQAPYLERGNKKIGVVTGVQSYCWEEITVTGKSSHTETTPLDDRADPMLAAAKMIAKSREIALKYDGLVSTGLIEASPRSFNVLPETVKFSLDTRNYDDAKLDAMLVELKEEFAKIAEECIGKDSKIPITIDYNHLMTSRRAYFHEDCKDCIRDASHEVVGEEYTMDLVARACHDSKAMSTIVPTAMVFIPCRDGLSHNPREFSTPEQCEDGFKVLMGAVLRYDQLRASRA
ncbi:unnamed protein product [Kuraishia capsulata CBS 1993]|uniref:Peptidase M20 dimerisation domain-containing protein n=1 Tax=Kuraishia capsulata CBS 1993 TaxID=1382522 RepID=W6MIW0_9ASCO|nr:uncharacterized protein KUCA_T00002077001 [Kuraishia capsulata CBS 1993]CDK26106.1 unnamed protein product [Kuraishia capsulata CBS 1993]